jgi:hypothetical protein
MEEKKNFRIMRIIFCVFIILNSVLGLINAYDVISLPKTVAVILNLLSICSIIGLGYVGFKQLSDK